MIPEDITGFLRGIAPFSDCPSGALRRVAATAEVLFVPRGGRLPAAPDDIGTHLHLIRKGMVQGPTRPGCPGTVLAPGAWLDDATGATDTTGTAPCTALTDVLCILLERNAVADALATTPGLVALLAPRCSAALRDRAAAEMRRTTLLARHEADTWHHTTLATLTTRPAPCVAPGDAIGEAARAMVDSGGSAVLVVEGGCPCGIVTVRDLTARVLARGGDSAQPVGGIMSSPVFTLPPETPALDALLAMTARGIHHVAVVPETLAHGEAPHAMLHPDARCAAQEGDDGDRERGGGDGHTGVDGFDGQGRDSTHHRESPHDSRADDTPPCLLSSDDLLSLRGTSPAALFAALREAKGLSDLVGVATRVDALAFDLLCEGAGPEALHTVTARLHDRLALRLIHMAEETLGPPPVPYAFVTFGPAAREEALLRPVQRTGIVFMPPPDEASPETGMRAARYCRSVATFVTDGLAALGFARDPQGRMAPALTLPLHRWMALCANGEATNEAEGEASDAAGVNGSAPSISLARAGRGARESATASSPPPDLSACGMGSPPLLAPRIPTADLCDARTLHGAESLTSTVRDAARHAVCHAAHPAIRHTPTADAMTRGQALSHPDPHAMLQALVDAVRLLAVRLGVDAVGTRSRLRLAEGQAKPDTASVYPEARCALDVLLLITAHDAARGGPAPTGPGDMPPAPRSPLEALALRRAEAAVARFIHHVNRRDTVSPRPPRTRAGQDHDAP